MHSTFNLYHARLHFTITYQNGNTLSFLEVPLLVKNNGKIETNWFTKSLVLKDFLISHMAIKDLKIKKVHQLYNTYNNKKKTKPYLRGTSENIQSVLFFETVHKVQKNNMNFMLVFIQKCNIQNLPCNQYTF